MHLMLHTKHACDVGIKYISVVSEDAEYNSFIVSKCKLT